MRRTLLHVVMGLGLLVGLIAGVVATTSAAPDDPGQPTLFFPWVPREDDLAGIAGISGTVTIQNLEVFPVQVTLTDAGGATLTSITLNPRASQSWRADQLGIAAPGSGVVATATWAAADPQDLYEVGICAHGTTTTTRSGNGSTVDTGIAVSFAPQRVTVVQDGFTYPASAYTWSYSGGFLTIDWSPAGAEPGEGQEYTIHYYGNCAEPRIAGVEKHMVGTTEVRTTAQTAMVDGYSAVPVQDVALADNGGALLEGQSRWVLPIVQTNNGWNTAIVVTNVSGKTTSVSATFYAAGGQGYAGPSVALLSGESLGPGESVRVDLREDAGFPEGEVGSVWIDASNAVVAVAFRHKPATEMLLTTVAQPRHDRHDNGADLRFGPLVFRDYNGWNTGINIANLSSQPNRVTVTYYNYAGNVVASDTVVIPERGMEYIYTPATGSFGLGANQITAARIAGDHPLAAAIDEVKYVGGQDQWHAMSYAAGRAQAGGRVVASDGTPVNGRMLYESLLGLPLVQKGNPATGYGDTSGINLYNPDLGNPVEAWVQFLDASGVPVAPTVAATDAEDPLTIQIPAGSGATIYTLGYSHLAEGVVGSAVVGVVGDGALVGVSNNVNYEVGGDGSAVYNLTVTPEATPRFFSNFTVQADEADEPVTDEDGNPNEFTARVTAYDLFGDRLPGIPVYLAVLSGPNQGATDAATTDGNGEADLSYASNGVIDPDTDTIEIWVDGDRDGVKDPDETRTYTKTWLLGEGRAVTVTPDSDQNPIGTQHTLTVTVTDGSDANNPVPGAAVTCEVRTGDGPNAGATFTYSDASQQTDANGQIECTYTGTDPGQDTITATADGASGTATKAWFGGQLTLSAQFIVEGDSRIASNSSTAATVLTFQVITGGAGSPNQSFRLELVSTNMTVSFEECTEPTVSSANVPVAALASRDIYVCEGQAGDSFTVNVYWTDYGDALAASATFEVIDGTTLDGSTEANPTTITTDETSLITTTVTANDQPIAGLRVCFNVNGPGELALVCGVTDNDGKISTVMTPTSDGSVDVGPYYDINNNRVWDGGTDIPLGPFVTITVNPAG